MITVFPQAVKVWNDVWLVPDAARNLAAARVLIAAHTLWTLLSRDYGAISGLQEFWTEVPVSRQLRYLLFPGHPMIEGILQTVAAIALIAALLGVLPRLSCFVGGILVYHLAPLETIFWTATPYARGLTIAPIALIVLSLSPCGDALTIGLRGSRKVRCGSSWSYGWPVRLIQFLVANMFLFSAYGKLRESGLSWSSAENMSTTLVRFNIDPAQGRFHELGLWIADHPFLCLAIGVGTVVFEWIFIVAVFNRKARWVFVPLALLFHLGIMFGMNVHVGETWLVLVFVNWDWVLMRISSRLARSSEPGLASAAS